MSCWRVITKQLIIITIWCHFCRSSDISSSTERTWHNFNFGLLWHQKTWNIQRMSHMYSFFLWHFNSALWCHCVAWHPRALSLSLYRKELLCSTKERSSHYLNYTRASKWMNIHSWLSYPFNEHSLTSESKEERERERENNWEKSL